MDNDVFEDFPSDQEFSDGEHEDGDAVLSDDEIARVLGLMDVGVAAKPNQIPAHANEPPVEADAAHVKSVDRSKAASVVGDISTGQTGQLRCRIPESEMSDFDRFLEDFTRQQETATSANIASVAPPSGGQHLQVVMVASHSDSLDECSSFVQEPPAQQLLSCREGSSIVPATKCEPPLRWGVFAPDKMPVRRECSSVSSVLSVSTLSPIKNKDLKAKSKLRVLVPSVAFLRAKSRRPPRSADPVDKEPSFRPTINKAYFRRRGMVRLRGQSREHFTSRMEKDIHDRQTRQQKRIDEKQRQEAADVKQFQGRRRSLVAKGSQAILERNGLWDESMDARLERLVKASHGQPPTKHEDASTKAKRKKALRDKEKAKTRACESLYKRGLDKLQRTRDDEKKPKHMNHRQRPARSRHTDELVRKRLEREVSLICSSECGSTRSLKSNTNKSELGNDALDLPACVSFVEFSCVLLYFGFVPDANTPYEGDSGVTLLWHAWLVFAEGEGDNRNVAIDELKKLLEAVIVAPAWSTALHSHKKRRGGDDRKTRLLQLFRVNYIARNRSRNASTTPGDLSVNTRTRASAKGAKTAYSLHGRQLRPHERGDRLDDLLAARHDRAQQRIEELRRTKQQEELAECTFKPRIVATNNSSDAVRQGYKFRSVNGEEESPETFERLYSDAFVRQNNSMARSYRARIEEDEKWKKEMHISPTYVNGLTIEERLQRLHESLSNNALPVSFHEKIAEMRRAYASKAEDEREKQSRLEPAAHRFPRTREGHTVVMPFTFATEERLHQSRPRVDHLRAHPDRVKSPHAKSTSALIRELRFEFESPTHGFIEGGEEELELQEQTEDVARPVADLCIDVHVSPLETYQLCLNRDDDVEEATKLFAEAYNLTVGQRMQLAKHATVQLKQLFDL